MLQIAKSQELIVINQNGKKLHYMIPNFQTLKGSYE